jgi:ribose 1,5-bisphosphokinase PhnN
MAIARFDQLGLINLTARHDVLHTQVNRRGRWPLRPVV